MSAGQGFHSDDANDLTGSAARQLIEGARGLDSVKTRTGKRAHHDIPHLRAVSAWVGLVLILFNVFSAATMGFGPMAGMDGSSSAICSAMGHGAAGKGPAHPGPHPSGDCACCLSMCCTGAAVPDDRFDVPLPSPGWTQLSFDTDASPQRRPAPSVGGIARAPPALV
jgi:hypothetical protein